jgi:holliday junction DNA helicase RuvB
MPRGFVKSYARRFDTVMEENEAQHILKSLLESAVSRHQAGQHILLCGNRARCDKTLQTVIPQIEGMTLRHLSASVLERAGDVAAILTHLNSGAFIFIDDLHRLSKPACEILEPALERYTLRMDVGKGTQMKRVELVLRPFTLIAWTARAQLLTQTLKHWFKQQIWIDDPDDLSSLRKPVIH